MGGSHGPWPGSFYAVPIAVALAVLGVLVLVALLWITLQFDRH